MVDKIIKLFKDGIINKSIKVLFIRVIGVVLFFSLTLFLTNFFSAKEVGRYDFSRSLLIILGGIAILGMNQSILYYSGYLTSKNALGSIKHLYYKMFKILLVSSVVLLVFPFFLGKDLINTFFQKEVFELVIKTTAILFLFSLTILNIDVFRAINKVYVSEIVRNILRYVPFFVFSILLILLDKKNWLIDAFLFGFVLTGIISTLYLLLTLKKDFLTNTTNSIEISYKEILKRSSPMAISSMAFLLMQSIDVILVGKFLAFTDVAYYSVTVKLTMVIGLVLSSVNAVNAPIISNLFNSSNRKGLEKNIQKTTRLIFILTIPVILGLTLLSGLILGFFGSEYLIAQNTLYVLLIGQAFNAFCGSVGIYMNMTGKQVVFQYLLLIAFILNVIFNWVLIPKYGIIGAAYATSGSMIFWNVAGAIYLLKKDAIKTYLH